MLTFGPFIIMRLLKILGRLSLRLFKVEVKYRGNVEKDNGWLLENRFNTIIDIGANQGQFALKMRRLFPQAKIISFEPIPEIYERLKDQFKHDSNFVVYPYALGEKEEVKRFHLNQKHDSSSFLGIHSHASHFEGSKEVKQIQVNVKRLDDLFSPEEIQLPLLIKIDVQGFEKPVIMGATELLKFAKVVLSEVSFVELYKNQALFDDIYQLMKGAGFDYHGNYDQLLSPRNNAVLQADAIFINKSSLLT